jgi:hypothetical protein
MASFLAYLFKHPRQHQICSKSHEITAKMTARSIPTQRYHFYHTITKTRHAPCSRRTCPRSAPTTHKKKSSLPPSAAPTLQAPTAAPNLLQIARKNHQNDRQINTYTLVPFLSHDCKKPPRTMQQKNMPSQCPDHTQKKAPLPPSAAPTRDSTKSAPNRTKLPPK